jgi:hypothetical protein
LKVPEGKAFLESLNPAWRLSLSTETHFRKKEKAISHVGKRPGAAENEKPQVGSRCWGGSTGNPDQMGGWDVSAEHMSPSPGWLMLGSKVAGQPLPQGLRSKALGLGKANESR